MGLGENRSHLLAGGGLRNRSGLDTLRLPRAPAASISAVAAARGCAAAVGSTGGAPAAIISVRWRLPSLPMEIHRGHGPTSKSRARSSHNHRDAGGKTTLPQAVSRPRRAKCKEGRAAGCGAQRLREKGTWDISNKWKKFKSPSPLERAF